MSIFTYVDTLEVITCCNCGMNFAMPNKFKKERRNDHGTFYCPAGHSQFFPGKSDEEKLKEEVEREKQRSEALRQTIDRQRDQIQAKENSLRATKAAKTRLKNRAINGVCLCCNRTFKDLAEHMKTMHPEEVKTPSVANIHNKISKKGK